jgi:hypothetical protein
MKGIVLTLDAIIALLLMVSIISLLIFFRTEPSSPFYIAQQLHFLSEDSLNILSKSTLKEVVTNQTLNDLNQNRVLNESYWNDKAIDIIGMLWAENNASSTLAAAKIAKDILGNILPNNIGYQVLINDYNIYDSSDDPLETSRPNYSDSTVEISSGRIASGYESNKTVSGCVAMAYLTSIKGKKDSSYVYFGGYVGDGNITAILNLPPFDNVTEAYMEMDAGNNFTLYINGSFSGSYTKGSAEGGYLRADKWVICNTTFNPTYCSYFKSGNNTIEFTFDKFINNYIGGGYLKVTYNTSEMVTTFIENISWFPGIKGLINLYSSFYIPGDLNNLSAYLHYKNNLSTTVFMTIGDDEVYRDDITGNVTVTLNNSYLNQTLNYTELNRQTIPLRFGTEAFALLPGVGFSDSILITDLSGSMGDCDVDSTCMPGICDTTPPCHQENIVVAKQADKSFVNTVLNVSGNRVGLVAYGTRVCSNDELTNRSSTLITRINGYDHNCGYTCISCGIDKAIKALLNSKYVQTIVFNNSLWLYNTSYPTGQPPNDINGTDWKNKSYNDSSWSNGNTVLGFDTYPYSPSVNTSITNNGGNYFFRKHFTIDDVNSIDYGELFVLSDDKAEVYLNSNLIDNDTTKHNATYWNRPNSSAIFYDGFETYYSNIAQRVDGYVLNVSPGYWYIDDGNGNPSIYGEEVYIMANQAGYPAYNGTDVLVFRDMDLYGYAQTQVNLSGRSGATLSYYWNMTSRFDDNEYSDVSIWDGQWHQIEIYYPNQGDNNYHYTEIDLSPYKMVKNFTIRFGSKSSEDNEVFSIDDVTVKEKVVINKSYFINGDNVLAVKLYNDDDNSAKFDLKLNITQSRYKAILVMSDGEANFCIPGWDCSDSVARQEAINKSCEARDNKITVYSVAFGASAGNDTLRRIACWNCSSNDWIPGCTRFYVGTNTTQLEQIYKNIAQDIVNVTYNVSQTINVTGNISFNNILYPDSYIWFNYTPILNPYEYGEISLNIETPRFGILTGDNNISIPYKEGWFNVSDKVKVVDAKVTSYSSQYWTDRLYVKNSTSDWNTIFNLSNYGNDYSILGDPFIVQIPVNYIGVGNNSVRIGTGFSPINATGGSPDDRVIYIIRVKGSVGYGNLNETCEGASNDAIQRLIDLIGGYVNFASDQITFQNNSISRVPYMWGPANVRIRVWS